MFTTVQDLGRWGYQSRGVPVSGAMDWWSHRLANRLVGNESSAATLEVTLIGPQLRFDGQAAFCVTGAEFSLTLDDMPVGMHRAIEAGAGAVLKFGARARGARAYVAIAGGLDVPRVLGSRSTHVLTRMGGYEGRALRTGDTLAICRDGKCEGMAAPQPSILTMSGGDGATLRVIPADEQLFTRLASLPFRVSSRSDRMGYRLEGSVGGTTTGELVSTSVPIGAIQVPPAGEPILLMNDHATAGGYAVAGVVITADLPLAGQMAPGDRIEFAACSTDVAQTALRRWESALGEP